MKQAKRRRTPGDEGPPPSRSPTRAAGVPWRALAALGIVSLAGAALPDPASGAGDPKAIRGLLKERCALCHDIPGLSSSRRTPSVPAPSFMAIANNPDMYPRERVRKWLRAPHWPMAGFILSQRDIENVLAFLDTLREGSPGGGERKAP